jgi:exopolysaccharide biosynthesis polyprenyl glycosylphosphotransferase
VKAIASDGRGTTSAANGAPVESAAASPRGLVLDNRTRELIEGRRSGRTRRRGWIVLRSLVLADLFGILAAFTAAEVIFLNHHVAGRFGIATEVGLFVISLPVWLVLAKMYGLYSCDEERADHSTADEVFSVFNMLAVGTLGFYAFTYLFPGLTAIPLSKILTFLALAVPLVVLARAAARRICRHTDAYTQNTLILGAGHIGQLVAHKLLQHPDYGMNVVGFVDDNPRARDECLGDLTVVGLPSDLPGIIRDYDVERVIVAFSGEPDAVTLGLVRDLNALDVQVDIIPRLFEVLGPETTIHTAEGLPLMGLPPSRLGRTALALKRAMDLAGSAAGIAILSPFLVVTSLAIKLDSPGPVFFRQTRVGLHDREFPILKFRTMVADADGRKQEIAHLNKHRNGDDRMFKVEHDPRVTRVGHFLRRHSLDELPQLWNVLRGQMSLVGPRPLIPEEHHHVDGWARRRLDLKPGMTGLWQVLGRDDIPFGEMVGLDYRYVTTWSLAHDVKLIFLTFTVLARSTA